MINIVLWIVQAILAIKLLTTAFTHGLRHDKPTLREAIQKYGLGAGPMLYLAALGTLLVALGLVLPGLLGAGWLVSPMAAAAAVMLLVSIYFHIRAREKPNIIVSIILCALAAFVAYGRWALAPL
jgi:hypothetical protein